MRYIELQVTVWEGKENFPTQPWDSDEKETRYVTLPYMDYDDSPDVVYGEITKSLAMDAYARLWEKKKQEAEDD